MHVHPHCNNFCRKPLTSYFLNILIQQSKNDIKSRTTMTRQESKPLMHYKGTEHQAVSNHQYALHHWPFVSGKPSQRPWMLQTFPCHDIIMAHKMYSSNYHYWQPYGESIASAVGRCYNMVQYIMILLITMQWQEQKLNKISNSQTTPYILLSQASYGVSVVRTFEKIDRVIMASHCNLREIDCVGPRHCSITMFPTYTHKNKIAFNSTNYWSP